MKKIFEIKGMHCNSCSRLIENALKDKVNNVSASYTKEEAEVDFDENKITEKEIISIIEKEGYEVKLLENIKQEEINSTMQNNSQLQNETKEEKISSNLENLKSTTKKIESVEKRIEEKEAEEVKELKSISKKIDKIDKKIEKKESDENEEDSKFTTTEKTILSLIGLTLLITFGYVIYNSGIISNFNLPNIQIPELGERTSLILLFLAGLLTGFHCISMCGGFVVSYTAKNALNGHKGFKQHLIYGGSKVLSYTIIGGIFGIIGGIFAFSIKLRGFVAIIAGIFMVFYALSMFGFKFFRKFQFNPKFLTKISSEASVKAGGPFKAPFITGLLNGLFLACGPLQAMYLYAMGTGNFFTGAISLMVFGLGTLPIMIGFGFLATTISHKTTGKILKVSAIIVLILGLIMLNRGLSLTGSNLNFDSIKTSLTGNVIANAVNANTVNGVQEINMDVGASGYSPNSFVLKKGIPVKWNINVKQLTGCNSELVVGQYNIDKNLKAGLNVIEFIPDETGTISFTCGMGMLRGSFIVTETGTATQNEIQAATPPKGMQCGGSGGGGCGCGG